MQAEVDVREITLHMNDLKIDKYGFNTNTPNFSYDNSTYKADYDKWTIPIPSTLNGGIFARGSRLKLFVKYQGFMRDDMAGFYRSYYMEGGRKVWMASTQFQSTSSRRAFPCFDVGFLIIDSNYSKSSKISKKN